MKAQLSLVLESNFRSSRTASSLVLNVLSYRNANCHANSALTAQKVTKVSDKHHGIRIVLTFVTIESTVSDSKVPQASTYGLNMNVLIRSSTRPESSR